PTPIPFSFSALPDREETVMSALPSSNPLPDLTRPDVGAALFSTWSVGTPERQRAAVDAIAATWDGRPWPAPELLSYNVYAGTDGDTLMHHSQWASEGAYHAFFRTHRQERNDEIDSAVPDLKRLGLSSYRFYRGFQAPPPLADPRTPGPAPGINDDEGTAYAAPEPADPR
uniref:hypothetical protein n=1 Tax=Bacillus mobilis TaxID=2026190 RepID=UPI003718FFF9